MDRNLDGARVMQDILRRSRGRKTGQKRDCSAETGAVEGRRKKQKRLGVAGDKNREQSSSGRD